MKARTGSRWQRNLREFVDDVLRREAVPVNPGIQRQTWCAVGDAVEAMPSPQRFVIVSLLSLPGRERGAWLARTEIPGARDVGRAVTSLVIFHACAQLDDPAVG